MDATGRHRGDYGSPWWSCARHGRCRAITRNWEGFKGILSWLLLGLIAGFLASRVMKGGGYGIIGDIVVGIVGALLGGFLFGLLTGNPNPVNNIDIGSIFVAFIGACILIAILRAISGRRAV